MRLKNLTIKGFKSFAEETTIHFNENITGIVGPNGSGKSNIVDAIRWVLGEQKGRELRLEQMSDVIFNGTKRKKEAPLAQVTLNFENTKNLLPTEYHHIEIARLLYRSGDSEYRLNGVPCRLKDITGLFLDTGVGSDSYAIIALNMVEDLLSNKESARRKMFEQAAGISKYKARKRESLNKLKSTKEDLARIEDLLFEINNNLTELEKQAKRTRRYNELKEKYKSAGLLVQFLSVQTLRKKMDEIESSIQNELLALGEEEASLTALEADIEKHKKEHLDQEKSLSDFQKKVNEVLDEIRSLESLIQINDQKIHMQRQQKEQLLFNMNQTRMKLSTLSHECTSIKSELDLCRMDLQQAEIVVNEQEQRFTAKQEQFNLLKTGVDQFQADKYNLENQIYELEKNRAICENQISNLIGDSNRGNEELKSKEEERILLEQQIGDMAAQIESSNAELDQKTKDELKRQENLKVIQEQIDDLNQKLSIVNRSKDAKTNEFELLKSMVEKMEGFPESIKFLHQNWRKDVPILSDLIYTEERYRPSIELFLENYLNYYVVHNEDEAVKAIRLLFNNTKGKANFFILDKFRNQHQESKALPGCRPALSVIEVTDIYKPLFNELLSNVYLLEDEQHLEDIIRFPDHISVVSLSGSVVKSNKMLSGGSVGLFEGKKIGRKKNLEKLEIEISKLEAQSLEFGRQLSELKDTLKEISLSGNPTELDQIRKRHTQLLQLSAEINAKRQHIQGVERELISRIERNEQGVAAFRIQKSEFDEQIQVLRLKLSELAQHLSNSDEEYNRVSTELSDSTASYNQSKLELLRWQNKLENLDKDLLLRDKQIQEVSIQIEADQNQAGTLDESIQQLTLELETSRANLLDRIEFRKSMDVNLSELEKTYYEMRNTISTQEGKVKAHQKRIQDLQSIVNSTRDQKAEVKFKIQTAYEKARIEFMVDLDGYAPDEADANQELQSIEEKAQYYKNRIDNYGEVNPLALEAYDEMKSRMEKIELQREDVLKAQDSLIETIKEIETTATAGFMQAFNQVRVHFQTVFRSLFTTDDDCDLILEDESNPLECDIDIVAKPKGKRPKSISQLSGGEKTLTAIALLFSLYLLKPAPFCIFDEVDAPLDDINIEKFNRIIRKFSKDSQFIIITHNKLTMADVDVLYGVYMEEPGVSSVTAVDFRKFGHEIELQEMAN